MGLGFYFVSLAFSDDVFEKVILGLVKTESIMN